MKSTENISNNKFIYISFLILKSNTLKEIKNMMWIKYVNIFSCNISFSSIKNILF